MRENTCCAYYYFNQSFRKNIRTPRHEIGTHEIGSVISYRIAVAFVRSDIDDSDNFAQHRYPSGPILFPLGDVRAGERVAVALYTPNTTPLHRERVRRTRETSFLSVLR